MIDELKKRKRSFHVHIYQICGMCELDVEANNSNEARTEAMKIVLEKHYGMMFPDIKQIALTFDEDESKGEGSGIS
jgi:hypothetical protein